MKYLEMIQDAIITLQDRKGSSRQALWKCVSAQHPEADYKQFLIRLKKESHEGHVLFDKGRYKLDASSKAKLLKGKSSGSKKTSATMKGSKRRS